MKNTPESKHLTETITPDIDDIKNISETNKKYTVHDIKKIKFDLDEEEDNDKNNTRSLILGKAVKRESIIISRCMVKKLHKYEFY